MVSAKITEIPYLLVATTHKILRQYRAIRRTHVVFKIIVAIFLAILCKKCPNTHTIVFIYF